MLWSSFEQGTRPLGMAAQRTRDAWDANIFATRGVSLPTLFAAHRQYVMERIEQSGVQGFAATFDHCALMALRHSLGVAQRLGAKEMPEDPVHMTKEVGDVYDRYCAQDAPDPSADKVIIGYTDHSIPILTELADQFKMSRSAVVALAGEYYGQLVLQQLSNVDTVDTLGVQNRQTLPAGGVTGA